MHLQEIVIRSMNDVMEYNRAYSTTQIAENIKATVPAAQPWRIKQIKNTVYNVLKSAAVGRFVTSHSNGGTGKYHKWERMSTLDYETVYDLIQQRNKLAQANARRGRPVTVKVAPEPEPEKKEGQRTLTAAVEYLFIAEEAVKEAKEILREIQSSLT